MEKQEHEKELACKIETVASKVGVMDKDGRNDHSNYSFVSHESVTKKIGSLLLENNLGIIPECVSYEERDYVSKGKNGVRTIVTMQFEVTDLETGYSKTKIFFGAENDIGGKSMQQAITQATKYFYFKLFKIPFGDDGDKKTSDGGKGGGKSVSVWFDPKNAKHLKSLQDNRNKGVSNEDIIKKIRDSGIGISKVNAELIINNEI